MYSRRSPLPLVWLAASLTVTAVFGLACYWCLRLAYADHLFRSGSPGEILRAIELAPGNATYLARSAALNPARSSELQRALELNPRHSAGWIEIGLRAEMRNDFSRAEQSLLEAARVDKTYEPRWTLANYYFRRDDPDRFWSWARQAAEMAYFDQAPLFELCWRVSQDPDTILSRAIPDRPQIQAQYLKYLLRTKRLDAANRVAQRLIEQGDRSQLPLLLAHCDLLQESGRTSAAIQVWNALSRRELISHRPLAPARAQSLTNGDFSVTPVGCGFDWRIATLPGVSVARTQSPQALRIQFSGGQPERCRILEQFLPLEPSREYRMSCLYRTSGIAPGSGLRWQITDATTGREFSSQSTDLSGEEWGEGTLAFRTPPDVNLGRLALLYERAPGAVRIEGSVWLRELSLRFGE